MAFATMQELLAHYHGRPHDLIRDIQTHVLGPPADGYDEAAVLCAARTKYYQCPAPREQAETDLDLFLRTGMLPLCYARFLLE